MEFEFFASVMTPGIALLILSTTMRLGNVRMALTEIAKLPTSDLESMESFTLFSGRASFLCQGLRLLNISMLVLVTGVLIRLLSFEHTTALLVAKCFDVALFVVLFFAMVFLFKESQLTGRSIVAHTKDIRERHKQV